MNKLTKIVAAGLVASLSFASVGNSIEVRGGISGVTSAYYGNVTETLKDSGKKSSEEAIAAFSYMSVFGEVAFDEAYGLTLGVEFTPDAIGLENADREIKGLAGSNEVRGNDNDADIDNHGDIQDIKADVKDLTNIYIGIPLMSTGVAIKVGYTMATLATKETLATGSTYKDMDLEGMSLGAYFDGEITDNLFYRLEGSYQEFDDIKAAGSQVGGTAGSFNSIAAELGGVAAKASLGFKF